MDLFYHILLIQICFIVEAKSFISIYPPQDLYLLFHTNNNYLEVSIMFTHQIMETRCLLVHLEDFIRVIMEVKIGNILCEALVH